MTKALGRLAATIIAVAATGAACTVHQADSAPPLTGPSGLGQSVTITATPDSITRDGQSQSAVAVRVIDANGQPAAGVAIRMDMLVDGSVVDFGTLAARTIATGADGRATTTYTAPPAPPTSVTATSMVTIRAIPVGTDAQATHEFVADIRLVPVGVIQGPGGIPAPSFTWSPTAIVNGAPVNFDASASTSGNEASAIVSYEWTFGDGTTGTGRTLTHTFASANTYNVTLTVTNDRGGKASTTHAVTVGAVNSTPPTPAFNFSPSAPGINETVFFNATASTAAAGRSITSYRWIFGDGSGADGVQVSHVYRTQGTYTITLTVTDDLGVSATASQSITPGSPQLPKPEFNFSPTTGIVIGAPVLFSASISTTAQGQTITDYFWNFGDDLSCPPVTGGTPSTCYVQTSSPTITHTYTRAGSFTVNLTVKDSAGRIAAATAKTVTVGVPGGSGGSRPTALFIFTSTPPPEHNMTYDGGGSTTVSGATIIKYEWNFGDGTSFSGALPVTTHAYTAAGPYTVTLVVTDSMGGTGGAFQTVPVP